jgi:membrane fusion protein (multidrug efflux system)
MNLKYLAILCVPILFSCQSGAKTKKNKADDKQPLEVETLVISSGHSSYSQLFTGNILANEAVEIRSEVPGRIQAIGFEEGAQVAKNQLLIKINDDELKAQLLKIEARVELATTEVARKKELFALKGISQEEMDISSNNLRTLQAEEALIKAQINKTEIRAPFSGTIGLRSFSPGAFVTASALLTTLQQTNLLKIDFKVPEKTNRMLAQGQSFTFTTEGSPKTYTAKVYAKESHIDAETRTILVRAICQNSDRQLVPGSFARIKLALNPEQQTISIPAQAVIPVLKGEQAYIVKNGTAAACPVISGVRTDSTVEILQGLNMGDTLILTGLLQLKPGQPIRSRTK